MCPVFNLKVEFMIHHSLLKIYAALKLLNSHWKRIYHIHDRDDPTNARSIDEQQIYTAVMARAVSLPLLSQHGIHANTIWLLRLYHMQHKRNRFYVAVACGRME